MKKINDVLSDHLLLKKNYNNFRNKLGIVDDSILKSSILKMPTTHTFTYERGIIIDSSSKAITSIFPARSIFFDDKALLSNNLQSQKKLPAFFSREMKKAREYGLDSYVFSYLGAHCFFYAKCEGMNTPAFGVFVSAKLESIQPNSNATLYDLSSRLAAPFKPEEITLIPKDARDLTASEIYHLYEKDFFNYWICHDYINKKFHDDEMWEHKREFHYYERIKVENIKAIIWPLEVYYDGNQEIKVDSQCLKEIFDLSRDFPNVKIYKYPWGGRKVERFSYASYLISKSVFETNQLPDEENFDDDFYKRFSDAKL